MMNNTGWDHTLLNAVVTKRKHDAGTITNNIKCLLSQIHLTVCYRKEDTAEK